MLFWGWGCAHYMGKYVFKYYFLVSENYYHQSTLFCIIVIKDSNIDNTTLKPFTGAMMRIVTIVQNQNKYLFIPVFGVCLLSIKQNNKTMKTSVHFCPTGYLATSPHLILFWKPHGKVIFHSVKKSFKEILILSARAQYSLNSNFTEA